MNRKMIFYTLGRMLILEGILMLLPFFTGLYYHESDAYSYLIIGILVSIIGLVMSYKKPKDTTIYAREGFVIVAFSWIALSVFGALPFYISQAIPSYVDALFETVSGFTTTGSSILTNIEALSHAHLFWRSFSHWVGGMGILVFVVAFLPDASGSTMHILKAEMPGPIVGKLVSKVTVSARLLYKIYAAMTVIEVVLLLMGGMPFFDSLLNAFGTAGTGGFGIKNTSIAFYNSAYVDSVITVFMILFGINFNVFYFIVIKRYMTALKNVEVRWYLFIISIATLAITLNIAHMYPSLLKAFRYAIFQVASIITTTGFVTADYGTWPLLSQVIIVLLMFVGACAGSTGGGIKVSRIVIVVKNAMAEMKRMIHPHSVISVDFEGQYLKNDVINNIHTYFVFYFIMFCLSLLIIACGNIDFTSAFSAVATCLNNVGPGLGVVGPTGNFSSLNDISKIVLAFDMLLGRLEIFPLLMLFSPSLWKK